MQLFHRIADKESAEVRAFIGAQGLKVKIDFRNIDVSEEARAELNRLGGRVPALWDGAKLWNGRDEIIKMLAGN